MVASYEWSITRDSCSRVTEKDERFEFEGDEYGVKQRRGRDCSASGDEAS